MSEQAEIQWNDPFELDDYQKEGVAFTEEYGRVFIGLPVGSGKTCIVLKASRKLRVQTLVVICQGNSLWTWVRQIHEWRPDLAERMVVMDPKKKIKAAQRHKIWNDPTIKVIIATVGTFRYDYPHINMVPTLLICDECQKYMRKKGSKTSGIIIEYGNACKYAAFLTGTGVSRGRQEFFQILQALRLKRFKSYWRFVNQYVYVTRTTFGMEFGAPRNTPQFREATKDIIFRPKSPVRLPDINRQLLPCEMEPDQEEFYRNIQENMYALTSEGDMVVTSTTLAQVTRLRQVLCCPKILDPGLSYGGGILTTLDHMEEEEDRRHAVLFSPFVEGMQYMQQAIQEKFNLPDEKIVTFKSGMGVDDLKDAEARFRGYPDSVAICSILFSQSFELETGNPAYFIGYSFNPDDNEQGEGRLRRKTTQRASVQAYYLQNLGTYDDRTLEVLGRKSLNIKVDVHDMHAIRGLIVKR